MRKQKTGMKILTFFIQGLKLKRNGLRNLALICTVDCHCLQIAYTVTLLVIVNTSLIKIWGTL